MASAIEATGLTKWYGKRRGILDLAFSVEDGEVFGFLGPNGAGKTTTIRLLMGFLRPSSGRILILGHDAWSDAPAAHALVSFVSSEPGYLGELTAREQLDYMAALRGLARGAWRPLAERLELDPTVPVRKLSRGNRQKVAIVQAFMGQEPLLVMDEPTSGLDPLMQREFLKLVAEVRSAGRTVFLSSHNLPEVERACDRVGIIREGRLVSISSVSELQASHWRSVNLMLDSPVPSGTFELPDVRVVSADARDVHLMVRGDVNPLLRRLATIDVHDVSIVTLEIEDVFLGYYERGDERPDEPTSEGEGARAPGTEART
jgi:ABC-2 type transport system ATP-binding protein